MADILFITNKFEKALKFYKFVYKKDTNDIESLIGIGNCY